VIRFSESGSTLPLRGELKDDVVHYSLRKVETLRVERPFLPKAK
jgi:hypothetical protein